MWFNLYTGGVVLIRSGAKDDQDEHHRDEELYSKSLERIVLRSEFSRSWQTWPEETFSATAVVPRPAWPLTVVGTITWRIVGFGRITLRMKYDGVGDDHLEYEGTNQPAQTLGHHVGQALQDSDLRRTASQN